MIACVDGTGKSSESEYWVDNRTSLISQLVRETRQTPARYFRGPIDSVSGIHSITNHVVEYVLRSRKSSSELVFLAVIVEEVRSALLPPVY